MDPVQSPPTARTGRSTRLKQYALFAALFVLPHRRRMRALNELDSVYTLFGERSMYHNLGYWKGAPGGLDEAGDAMAVLLAETAGVGRADAVLDAGSGFGDQDLLWAERFGAGRVVGLEVSPAKVRVARARAAARGLASRVEFIEGSATALPFRAAGFDAVLALESAFHFDTREDFFGEAFRVLRPGGALALTEPVPRPDRRQGRIGDYFGRAITATPKGNQYPRDEYAARLAAAGFTGAAVTSIYDDVFPPFMTFLLERIDARDVRRRVNPLVRMMWKGWARNYARTGDAGGDYIVAVARKPADS